MADALIARYAAIVCDLDGVVYAGPEPIEHAVEALVAASDNGAHVVYATNNASRTPAEVAGHLREFGLVVDDADVVNSSAAGAYLLAGSLTAGARVLAVGGAGVGVALTEAGLTPVSPQEARDGTPVEAVLQGYGAGVRASDLAEAGFAVAGGARWMATNTDLTLPTDRGVAPGNGSLVGAVRNAVGVDPEVAGKPMPTMYEMAARRSGVDAHQVLAIGDRLETDIEGAVRAGMDSVLVLTGVHDLADAAAAAPERRPTFVVEDLRSLAKPYDEDHSAPSTSHGDLTWSQARALLRATWAEVDAGELDADGARHRFTDLTVRSA